jgi:hypothetical protein
VQFAPGSLWLGRAFDPKRRNSCRHPLLNQYRAASWCKMAFIWAALGEGYEWVIFAGACKSEIRQRFRLYHLSLHALCADSDAVIREPNVSLEAFLQRNNAPVQTRNAARAALRKRGGRGSAATPLAGGILSGPTSLFDAALIFLADWPYSSLPCAGFWVARGGQRAQDLIRRWWDSNDTIHNLRHA